MRHWIEALLDPAPIEKGNKDKVNTQIQQPPKFDLDNATLAHLPTHTSLRASTRARSTRSVSPSKVATTPSRKIATPRKPRTTRGAAKSEIMKAEELLESSASKAASALQKVIANGGEDEPVAEESVNGEVKEVETQEPDVNDVKEGTVRIEVQETVETTGDVETKTTKVNIDVPHSHPELPEPEDPIKMVEEARRVVAEANKLEGGSSSVVKSLKRKADEVVEEDEVATARPSKAARVAYTTEQKLTKEKVTRRAFVGLTVMVAIG